MTKSIFARTVSGSLLAGLLLLMPRVAAGHCDTLGGPVVKDGRAALEKGDITPVLKWVKKEHEAELQRAFSRTLSVRTKGPEAKELADRYFLETVVRLHRAGEGAPYTGLKDEPADPVIALADRALAGDSDGELIKALSAHMAEAIDGKFKRAVTALRAKDVSVEAGREYVEAYVAFTHFVEGLHEAILGSAGEIHGVPATKNVPHK